MKRHLINSNQTIVQNTKKKKIDSINGVKNNKITSKVERKHIKTSENTVNDGKAKLRNDRKIIKKDELRVKCLKLYETLRQASCSPDQKTKIVNKLSALLFGKLNRVIRSHDLSRVVQFMLKFGTIDVKEKLVQEILNSATEISKQKYSVHVIRSAFRNSSSKCRRILIKALVKDTISLLSSKIAAPLLEEVYTKYATSSEKKLFKNRIYGEAFKLNEDDKNLSTYCEKYRDLAPAIISNTRKNLQKLMEKDWCRRSTILTTVLSEYEEICSEENKNDEFIENLKSHVSDLIISKNGCNVALNILWKASVKEKKSIVKQLSQNFLKLAKSESGSLFIISLFDSVDDTVLLNKAIISKINQNLDELMANNYGRRIIIYIFLHREAKSFFSPIEIEQLKLADQSQSLKKNSSQRLNEIRNYCFKTIINNIEGKPENWILLGSAGLILIAVFQYGGNNELDSLDDETKIAFHAICKFIINNQELSNNKENIIENGCVHKILKKLIQNDVTRLEKNFVTFSSCLITYLTEDIFIKWIKINRGCFLLLWLLKNSIENVKNIMNKFLVKKKIHNILMEQTTVGANLLKTNLPNM